jgi:nucleotide-binding universal stress UspA family protein
MKEILVGIDGSAESRKAAQMAIDLARARGERIVLACVVPRPAAVGPDLQDLSEWERLEREYARTLLREFAERCSNAGVEAEEVMPSGRVGETLARMAAEEAISLVVVGHRERNALARALLGSVADELTRTSPKPVLIAR